MKLVLNVHVFVILAVVLARAPLLAVHAFHVPRKPGVVGAQLAAVALVCGAPRGWASAARANRRRRTNLRNVLLDDRVKRVLNFVADAKQFFCRF